MIDSKLVVIDRLRVVGCGHAPATNSLYMYVKLGYDPLYSTTFQYSHNKLARQ